MSTAVEMPALGESVTEGTISQWLVEVGETVEADQPLVEVATDKVDSEVPSPVAGTVLELCFEEDETVDVGTVICKIGDADEAGDSGAAKDADAGSSDQVQEEAAPQQPEEDADSAAKQDQDSGHKPDFPAAPPAPPAPQVPGESIPSSVSQHDGKNVVSWAYPQVGGGYPATQRAEGQQAPAAPAAPAAETSTFSSDEYYVTPLVRKLAKDKGVDLSQVKGTGQGGRIRKQDVLDAAAQAAQALAAAAPAPQAAAPSAPRAAIAEDTTLRGKTEKMSRMRQTIAERMMTSLNSTAQLTTVVEVDVTRIAQLRARAKNTFAKREGTKLSFLPFFVKAATEALKAHPKINSRIEDKQVTYFAHEHVGIAVDTERGLMVPVIKDAGDLTIAGIAKKINELAEATRTGKIDPSQLSGSTFTITNTGSRGALFDTPVVNYPEEAILGLGTIVKRPAVVKDCDGNETIAIRSMCYLALSYDHRLIDGADAARYLSTVKARLEDGDFAAEVGL